MPLRLTRFVFPRMGVLRAVDLCVQISLSFDTTPPQKTTSTTTLALRASFVAISVLVWTEPGRTGLFLTSRYTYSLQTVFLHALIDFTTRRPWTSGLKIESFVWSACCCGCLQLGRVWSLLVDEVWLILVESTQNFDLQQTLRITPAQLIWSTSVS